METNDLKAMTVRADGKVVEDFDELLQELRIRRDNYLRSQLEIEVEQLADIEPNSERAADFLRHGRLGRSKSRVKVNLKLPETLIARINVVCAEKRVSRDSFIETLLRFLAYGWPDQGIVSPLVKTAEYLRDPFRDLLGSSSLLYRQRCTLTDQQTELLQSLLEMEDAPADGDDFRSET